MAAPVSAYKDRQFLAVIGDEDSITGLLLAGVGHVTNPPDSQKNYLVVDDKTEDDTIEEAFENYTKKRKDIAIVLINQHVSSLIPPKDPSGRPATPADPGLQDIKPSTDIPQIAERIRNRVDTYTDAFPAVLEIPSKEHPYDPEKDSVLRRHTKPTTLASPLSTAGPPPTPLPRLLYSIIHRATTSVLAFGWKGPPPPPSPSPTNPPPDPSPLTLLTLILLLSNTVLIALILTSPRLHQHPLARTMRLHLLHILYAVLCVLAPLNIWACLYWGTMYVLKAYLIGVMGVMHGLAAAILIAGVLMPPAMLGFWVWETSGGRVGVEGEGEGEVGVGEVGGQGQGQGQGQEAVDGEGEAVRPEE
ncbi:MAG: H(+)-transporting V1 sector ATPase subunit F [Chrysothrix sp. TS-e1954]|nr:MAG: H(+)-transporting V1 sector ATPase subunit F [Chrysothrix sp. TS-e1954]